jgi:hypothetical protein
MANCKYCKKVITLVPSARERAKGSEHTASYYTKLFDSHSACMVAARDKQPNPVNGKKFDWLDGKLIEI